MITIRQMQYFDALGRTLHFGQAAEKMNISQPAISAQIALMEQELGCRLVERTRGAIVLTDEGKKLLPKIRRILRDVQLAQEEIGTHSGILSGALKIGIIPTVAPYVLPHIVPALNENYPQLKINIRETVTETLVADVVSGELDAMIAALPIKHNALRHDVLFIDRFHMAVSANESDVLASPMSQNDVALDRLLLLEDGHCLRDQALAVCNTKNEKRIVDFGATSMPTLLQMVAHNMGQTLLPEIAIQAETARNPDIHIVPFSAPEPSRTIALFWRKAWDRQADMKAFGDVVRDVMR